MSDTVIIPNLPGLSLNTNKASPFPKSKTVVASPPKPKIVISPKCALPTQPTIPVTPIITENSSYNNLAINNMENELNILGYKILGKIVVNDLNGHKHIKYLKVINKKCHKLFIYVDIIGYSSVQSTDMVINETESGNSLSYSIKNGACNCMGNDVNGIAFEYGTNSICTLVRENNNVNLVESNYSFINLQNNNENNITSYPIIRLSEIKVNPEIVLENTDTVIRRLRTAEDSNERNELNNTHCSLELLNEAFIDFNDSCNEVTDKLVISLNQLKEWNDIYLNDPPCDDEYKEKFQKLQCKLTNTNDDVLKLIYIMKRVASKKRELEKITAEVKELTCFMNKEFVDY